MYKNSPITKKERDCLVTLGKNRNSEFPFRLIDLSRDMDIKPPTALNLIMRLENKFYVLREKGMIKLSETGTKKFMEIEETHRVFETLMVKYGLSLDTACALSENLDFLLKHEDIDRMFDLLGKPKKCPHGVDIVQSH
ncbi:MAG: metal-dependent transcriptional regulator [Candidatus Thermoplasmatota archaeon]|jgi:Mn-dependent DtxR family transcriptional regulator|nr:metal-dependent transcriptional regulator [Candidatus Thermoplasmatota archaeon]MCL5987706.1 metal-dependent transcriptional regulator [Candidatus Thermoplasmatota archaeon]